MKSRSPFLQKDPIKKTPNPVIEDPKPAKVFDFGDPKTRPFKTNIPDEEYDRRKTQGILEKTLGISSWMPKQDSESDKYPIRTFQRKHLSSPNEPEDKTWGYKDVKDIRAKYLSPAPVITENSKVDFESAVTDKGSRQFLERYNNPWAREKMKKQNNGMTDYDIDNFILHGLTAKKVDPSGLNPRYDGVYNNDKHEIKIRPGYEEQVETHERVHASRFDNIQGKNLQKILGNAWHQNDKNYFRDIKDYMNQPHEAYGNFAEFREEIKLKPGEKIDAKELERRVKKGKLQNSNFYNTYDNEKIVEALNTIASNDSTSSSPWTNKHTNA
jgi:hypothetical protein